MTSIIFIADIPVCMCSELQCTGSAVTLTVTGGQCQTFVNGSEVTDSCQLHHVSLTCLEFMIVTRCRDFMNGRRRCRDIMDIFT